MKSRAGEMPQIQQGSKSKRTPVVRKPIEPEAPEQAKTSTPKTTEPKATERRVAAARNPARRATDFPTDSTAIPAKNRPGDAAIIERTGKSWRDWFFLLNSAGVDREARQKVIAANTKANFWWRNVVLVAYELDCGMREQYAKPEGYEISISKTVPVPVAKLFAQWSKEELRNAWLGAKPIVIRKETLNKSMRITWEDGETWLSVDFYPLDADKARVVVQHQKLSQKRVAPMKVFWTETLKELKRAAEATTQA